jgi:hypothetical protein
MGERNQEAVNTGPLDDFFESALGEMSDDDFEDLAPVSSEKQRLAAKRRRAEQRLEERRLRDELGDYDLHLDDF